MQQDTNAPRDFERSRLIRVMPDDVFDFISAINNLPAYLPVVKHAEPQGEDRVRLDVRVRGQEHSADGYLRANDDRRRLEWGSDAGDYRGWMTVEDEDGQARVTVHLTWEAESAFPERVESRSPEPDPIDQGLENSLDSIKNILEGTGGPVEPPAAE